MGKITKFKSTIEVEARTKEEAISKVNRDMSGYVYVEKIASGPTYNVYLFRKSKR